MGELCLGMRSHIDTMCSTSTAPSGAGFLETDGSSLRSNAWGACRRGSGRRPGGVRQRGIEVGSSVLAAHWTEAAPPQPRSYAIRAEAMTAWQPDGLLGAREANGALVGGRRRRASPVLQDDLRLPLREALCHSPLAVTILGRYEAIERRRARMIAGMPVRRKRTAVRRPGCPLFHRRPPPLVDIVDNNRRSGGTPALVLLATSFTPAWTAIGVLCCQSGGQWRSCFACSPSYWWHAEPTAAARGWWRRRRG